MFIRMVNDATMYDNEKMHWYGVGARRILRLQQAERVSGKIRLYDVRIRVQNK